MTIIPINIDFLQPSGIIVNIDTTINNETIVEIDILFDDATPTPTPMPY